ncbi:Casein kinase II subunit beta' [Raphanus sativus]|uniref:Casein kinase II subunit beta n=1 Tax=Raphanus sativus TaxID=3726 RepID=A0A6J0LLY4_RAPSA|nr:casein kinase II subunit beta-2 isoform X1 [Raphanus sativus]KAJ4902612.1 Casein kinase II subunit beta' [Raphanus sativus]
MYKESGLKSEVVDRKRLYELYDNGACHPMFQTSSGASNSVKQLHDHSNRDSRSDAVDTDSKESGISTGFDVKDDTSWISWFCNLRGNELFCQIDDDYIQDQFNLCGLIHQVPYYDYALDLILDVDFTHGERFTEKQYELVESAAEMLYGMIHARYILTTQGLASMLDKYKNHDFGRCPRVYCGGQPCLPIGQSDNPLASTIKIYCPKCEDVYYPRSKYQANIDGAYFGTTFPHLFLMTYGDMKPQKASQSYVPKVFGFKLHKP